MKDGQVTLYELRRFLEEQVLQETAPILQHPILEGDPEQIIVSVTKPEDPNPSESASIATFYKIEERSYESLLFNNSDSLLIQLVDAFKFAVENKNYFSGKPAMIPSIIQSLIMRI